VEGIQLPITSILKNKKIKRIKKTDKINQRQRWIQTDKVEKRSKGIGYRPIIVDAQCSTVTRKISINIVSQVRQVRQSQKHPSTYYTQSILLKKQVIRCCRKYSLTEVLERHLLLSKEKPKMYIGVPVNGFFIIDLLIKKQIFLFNFIEDKVKRYVFSFNDSFGLSAINASIVLGVQKSSELFFVKFNLYSYVIVRKWLAA